MLSIGNRSMYVSVHVLMCFRGAFVLPGPFTPRFARYLRDNSSSRINVVFLFGYVDLVRLDCALSGEREAIFRVICKVPCLG